VKDALKWYKLGAIEAARRARATDPYTWWTRGAVGDYQEGRKTLFNQGLFEESSTARQRLGTKRELDDGRIYRYIGLTAAAITVSGTLLSKVQTPVDATIAAADVVSGTAVGTRRVSCTAAGATANLYADGVCIIKAGADIGSMYKIRGNTATNIPATGRIWLELYDKIFITWVAANTTLALHQNPYKDLLLNPAVANEAATTQELVMAMATRPMTASYYGWGQTHGLAAMVLDVAAAAGAEANEGIVVPGSTAGSGLVRADTAPLGMNIIAYTLESADLTNTEANLVFLVLE